MERASGSARNTLRVPLGFMTVLVVALTASCLAGTACSDGAWWGDGGAGDPFAFLVAGEPDDGDSTESLYQEVTIVRVVDGDTLIVSTSNGQQRLRLIGIDAPESVSPDPEDNSGEGDLASAYLHSIIDPLVEDGVPVYLMKDVSETDRYGRLLRYVWLEKPSDPRSVEEVRTEMLNGMIVDAGYARAVGYPPDTAYDVEFEYLELEACAQNRGISSTWS
jgi:micrococcal nuclease